MQAQARRDTACELALRRELHARGLRFRVNTRPLAGVRRQADVVFSARRVAVFVDGCFWHGCREHRERVKTNGRWWAAKLARNVRRDRQTNAILGTWGWTVVRVWEHADPTLAAALVDRLVRGHTTRASPPGIGVVVLQPGTRTQARRRAHTK
jgi:DNA mismatch endonuclease (patch repair protein)